MRVPVGRQDQEGYQAVPPPTEPIHGEANNFPRQRDLLIRKTRLVDGLRLLFSWAANHSEILIIESLAQFTGIRSIRVPLLRLNYLFQR